ncbi:MAG: AbrB/MazE/SpoVT family DNA-binding domain-containing protein [Desulfobacterales bacterium]
MHVSKLSAKGQVTIPLQIRRALGIEPGDLVAYEIQGQSVKIKRIAPFDAVFHSAVSETLEEWNSPDDDEAFRDL